MGTMVIALDPQGNPFGLWQSGMHTGVQIHNEPGALAWNEAMVDDTAAAKQFYTAVFGFTFDADGAEMAGEGMDYATFSTGGNPLGGLGASDPSMPKGWLTCFSVASDRRGGGHGRGEGRQGDDAADGHAVRAVRHRRGPVGRAVRGHADPPA